MDDQLVLLAQAFVVLEERDQLAEDAGDVAAVADDGGFYLRCVSSPARSCAMPRFGTCTSLRFHAPVALSWY